MGLNTSFCYLHEGGSSLGDSNIYSIWEFLADIMHLFDFTKKAIYQPDSSVIIITSAPVGFSVISVT